MSSIHAVSFPLQLPPGALGAAAVSSDVRCFLVPHATGVLLVDAGLPGGADALGAALARMSADWSDVSDIVVTHAHFDHVGGLRDVLGRAVGAVLHAGAGEIADVQAAATGHQATSLTSGDHVAGFSVRPTPGHTAGHLCLLDEDAGVLLAGDVVGSLDGNLIRPPSMFTSDAVTAERSLAELASFGVARLITSHGDELADGPQQLLALSAAGSAAHATS